MAIDCCESRAACHRWDSTAYFCPCKLYYWGWSCFLALFIFSPVVKSYNFFWSTLQTVEAERISVDHVAHLKPSDGGSAATQCKFLDSSPLVFSRDKCHVTFFLFFRNNKTRSGVDVWKMIFFCECYFNMPFFPLFLISYSGCSPYWHT